MSNSKLTPELVSLIHHVELNKSGWKDKAVCRIIMLAAYSIAKPVNTTDIAEWLKYNLAIVIPSIKIEECCYSLVKSLIFVKPSSNQYKLSESAFVSVKNDVKENEELEKYVMQRFEDLIASRELGIDIQRLWENFCDGFLGPYIHEMGAKAIELISDKTNDLTSNKKLDDFLLEYRQEVRPPIRDAILEFIDPNDTMVRSYICRQMNSCFFIEAGNLSDATVRHIAKSLTKKPELFVFLDTNFLFSMLDLHDNPANEAAKSLLTLAKELKGKVNVKLYAAPMTLEEANSVLVHYEVRLREFNTNPKLVEAALKSPEISGFTKKFLEASLKSGGTLTASEYFAPFADNLLTVIRSKGIEVYNDKWDHYRKEQAVIDEIHDQLKFEFERANGKAKDYGALEHDITLMHFVNDLRPTVIENTVDAKYWISTIDYKLLAYDKFYSRIKKIHNVCIHPSALVQMLQFWIPRTEALEQAMVSNMRLPLLLAAGFDSHAEQVSFDILTSLSRYENIDALDNDTITRILVNEGLRQRVSSCKDINAKVERVYEAILDEHKELTTKLQLLESSKTALQGAAEQLQIEKQHIECKLNEAISEKLKNDAALSLIASENSSLKDRVTELDKKLLETSNTLNTTLKQIEMQNSLAEKTKAKSSFFQVYIYTPIAVIAAVNVFARLYASASLDYKLVVIFDFVAINVWIFLVSYRWKQIPKLGHLKFFYYMNKLRMFISAILLLAIVPLCISLAAEIVKNNLAGKEVTIENLWALLMNALP